MSTELTILPSIPAALKILDRLADEIETAPTLEALNKIANAARGYQNTFRDVKGVSDRSGELWVRAEVKLATELATMPLATGSRGTFRGRDSSGSAILEPPENDTPTLEELGVDKKRSARAKHLLDIPKDDLDEYIEELKDENKGITPNAILAKKRGRAKTEKQHAVATAAFSETGPFDCAVIDPPWNMRPHQIKQRS
jgi:hypothetical protein